MGQIGPSGPQTLSWTDAGDGIPRTDATDDPVDRVLAERAFSPVFQPIVRGASGDVLGVEALGRPAPETGFHHVGQLLDAATRTGRRTELELALARTALAEARDRGVRAPVFINASPGVFCEPAFADLLETFSQPQKEGAALSIVVELTEEDDRVSIERLVFVAARFRELGVRIASDDIGVGAQDLIRLASLRPDWIKLDRSLTGDIESNLGLQALVSSMLHLAEGIGGGLIAEGVERASQLETLGALGVRWFQGFGLARPAPLDDLHKWRVRDAYRWPSAA